MKAVVLPGARPELTGRIVDVVKSTPQVAYVLVPGRPLLDAVPPSKLYPLAHEVLALRADFDLWRARQPGPSRPKTRIALHVASCPAFRSGLPSSLVGWLRREDAVDALRHAFWSDAAGRQIATTRDLCAGEVMAARRWFSGYVQDGTEVDMERARIERQAALEEWAENNQEAALGMALPSVMDKECYCCGQKADRCQVVIGRAVARVCYECDGARFIKRDAGRGDGLWFLDCPAHGEANWERTLYARAVGLFNARWHASVRYPRGHEEKDWKEMLDSLRQQWRERDEEEVVGDE